jgi:hypothetical protein
MKEHLQILDTRKFLRILLVGIIIYLISFVITFINIQTWGFFVWLVVPILFIILFFSIGLYFAKRVADIEISSNFYEFDKIRFQLIDITSYEFVSTVSSHRLNIRLKDHQKISLTIRDSSNDTGKFMTLVERMLNDIEDYNSGNNLHKIIEYDFYNTKNSKIVGVLFIILDAILTYFIIFNDSQRFPILMKYFGAIMFNIVILTYVYRIFKKK